MCRSVISGLAVDIRNNAIGKHGDQIPGGGEHECERVLLTRQFPKSLVRIAQEMHQCRPQEHAAGELRPHYEETLVPLHEIRRHPSGEGPREYQYQAPYFDQNQRPGPEVRLLRAGIGVGFGVGVGVGAAVGGGGKDEEEGEE